MSPIVHPHHHLGTGTWSYVVADPASGEAALIDPVLDYDAASGRTCTASAEVLLRDVGDHGYKVRWLLETHAHADHLTAAHWLKRVFPDATLAIGQGIRIVQETFRPIFNLGERFPVDGSQFDHLFEADEHFALGELQVRVIPVPGHTSDSNAYLIGDALFTGDTLFMPDSGTARCDFPGGDARTLFRSIQRLFELPDATRVFVGHDYGKRIDQGSDRAVACETTIGEQKRGNIHIHTGIDEAEFVRIRQQRDATLSMPALIIPAVQTNLRAGAFPPAEDNGVRYLKIPIDKL
jgi:glyoxylase-like metal-dependent hydrolase (beta-lactamase superfamily II)